MKKEKGPFTSFRDIFTTFRWKPIYGCPGRYILYEKQQYTLTEITGNRTDVKMFSTPNARDKVCVVSLDDGGIISYKKDDGSFVHTLNNTAGFKKKLSLLQIEDMVLDGR